MGGSRDLVTMMSVPIVQFKKKRHLGGDWYVTCSKASPYRNF